MFYGFLLELRAQGLVVGIGEWTGLLRALEQGLAATPRELHTLGRALLCRTEADYDRYDLAFARAFEGATLSEDTKKQLLEWLERAADASGERVDPGIADADLWRAFLDRLAQQDTEHHGGNRWVGTGGTSPFGHSGRAARGIRAGRDPGAARRRSRGEWRPAGRRGHPGCRR